MPVIQTWLTHLTSLAPSLCLHFLFTPSSPVRPLCPSFSFPTRPLLSFSLRGRFSWWWPWRPLLDPWPELANSLSERGEDGALLQEGLCRRPPPWHRWRWRHRTVFQGCPAVDSHCTNYHTFTTGRLPEQSFSLAAELSEPCLRPPFNGTFKSQSFFFLISSLAVVQKLS